MHEFKHRAVAKIKIDTPHGTPTGLQQKHQFVVHVVASVMHCVTELEVGHVNSSSSLSCLDSKRVALQVSLLNYKF